MKAFLAAVAFTVLAAVAGSLVLNTYQVSSADRYSTSGVRLGAEN